MTGVTDQLSSWAVGPMRDARWRLWRPVAPPNLDLAEAGARIRDFVVEARVDLKVELDYRAPMLNWNPRSWFRRAFWQMRTRGRVQASSTP